MAQFEKTVDSFSEKVLQAIDCLTRRASETYPRFIERIKQNSLARKVKLADLEDNMDLRRIAIRSKADYSRLSMYRKAWAVLRSGGD